MKIKSCRVHCAGKQRLPSIFTTDPLKRNFTPICDCVSYCSKLACHKIAYKKPFPVARLLILFVLFCFCDSRQRIERSERSSTPPQ